MEVPYALDNLDKAREFTGTEAGDDALARTLSHSWTAFARTGDPNVAGLPHWPAFNGKTRVQQHQLVYAAFKGRMGTELHALALETRPIED